MMKCDHGLVPDFLRITHTIPEKPVPQALNHGQHFEGRKEAAECRTAELAMGIIQPKGAHFHEV